MLHIDVNMVHLKRQIQDLGLYVEVAFIGPNLESYMYNQSQHNKATLLFDWVPNTLTAVNNYTRVKLPPCRTRAPDESCDFEIHQMSKVHVIHGIDQDYITIQDNKQVVYT